MSGADATDLRRRRFRDFAWVFEHAGKEKLLSGKGSPNCCRRVLLVRIARASQDTLLAQR